MKNFITNYRTFVTECETPLDYFLIGWAHFLAAIVVTGTGRIAYELITNPSTSLATRPKNVTEYLDVSLLKLISGLVIELKFKSSTGQAGVNLYKSELLSVSNVSIFSG